MKLSIYINVVYRRGGVKVEKKCGTPTLTPSLKIFRVFSGPVAGKLCVFPFTFYEQTYGCIFTHHDNFNKVKKNTFSLQNLYFYHVALVFYQNI